MFILLILWAPINYKINYGGITMTRTLISELQNHIGNEVLLKGWVHRTRKLGKIAFILLRERTGIVQCVINTKEINIKNLKLESVVEFTGIVTANESVNNGVELHVNELKTINLVNEELPLEINKEELNANLDTVLNNRVLSLRHPKNNAIFKIQASIVHQFSKFLINKGFTQVFTPKIVSEGAEGGTELFEIKYFNEKAYLAQSPQFYKQMMVGSGYERVFEIGHVYRAEKHDSKRHLNEYVSLDIEMGFIEDENILMELETNLLKNIFDGLNETCSNELNLLNINLPNINNEIPKLKLSEAIEILKKHYNKSNLVKDIDSEGEKLLSEYVKEKYNSDFVFLTHYPKSKRPMYTLPAANNETHSFDLIFRGLEITTGGLRIHKYEELRESMLSNGLNIKSFEDYLKGFKYGMPPHGGFAIGLERLTAKILGLENVRESSLFPRDKHRLNP